jgi:hypothetical protein
MRALQELKTANEKIIDLERRLEDAAKQISSLTSRRLGDPLVTVEPTVKTVHEQPQHAATTSITLIYETGWDEVFIHYQADQRRKSLPIWFQ